MQSRQVREQAKREVSKGVSSSHSAEASAFTKRVGLQKRCRQREAEASLRYKASKSAASSVKYPEASSSSCEQATRSKRDAASARVRGLNGEGFSDIWRGKKTCKWWWMENRPNIKKMKEQGLQDRCLK